MHKNVFVVNLLLLQGQYLVQPHSCVKEHGKHGFVPNVRELPPAVVVEHLPDFFLVEGTNLHLWLLHILYLGAGISLRVPLLQTILEE